MEDKILHCQFPGARQRPTCAPLILKCTTISYTSNSLAQASETPPWPTCAPCSRSPQPRLPGIEALPSPRQGEFFPAKKMSRLSRPTTLKNNFQLSCGGRTAARIFFANGCEAPAARHSPAAPARHSLQPAKPAPAPKVRQRCCPRSIADRVFFHHSHALPSILLWQQDCPLQSCCGNRIASPIPVLATRLPRCITSSSGLELFFPERRLVMESAPL